MSRLVLHPLVNIALLNIAWLVTVLGAAHGWVLLGPAFTALWLGWHLGALGPGWQREAAIIAGAGVIGYLLDSVLVLGGAFAFPEQAQAGAPSTVWMVALWLNLAAGLLRGFPFVLRRPVLAAALGAVGGPLAYWGGYQLGAVTFTDPVVFTLAVGLEWALAPLLLILLVRRVERWGQPACRRLA